MMTGFSEEKQRRKEAAVTPEMLRSVIQYDPKTGILTKNGKVIGGPQKRGPYGQIRAFGFCLSAHRVAFAVHFGRWPSGVLDHADGNTSNNRIANLRECSQANNVANQRRRSDNKSGVKGVYWDASRKLWHAQIVKEPGTGKSKSPGRS